MKLTQTVKKGGCAAKVAAHELRDILKRVSFPAKQPSLLINGSDFDDAAITKISDELCLVETLDFFTPIVDDPYLFGRVASANAMSDVYAMGGVPKTALAILAFPLATLDNATAAAILQGAVDTLALANADLAGGHSIDDDTLKFGLSVTGFAHPDKLWTNKGAQAGDALILTKGLGTGALMAGLKSEAYNDADLAEAYASMTTLNDIKTCLTERESAAIHAATDVTGFGVAGHGFQMAKASGVTLAIYAADLPKLKNAAFALSKGILTKAHRTNREYVADDLVIDKGVSDLDQLFFYDPQTSGGLLLSVDATQASSIVLKLREKFPHSRVIGEVMPFSEKRLRLES